MIWYDTSEKLRPLLAYWPVPTQLTQRSSDGSFLLMVLVFSVVVLLAQLELTLALKVSHIHPCTTMLSHTKIKFVLYSSHWLQKNRHRSDTTEITSPEWKAPAWAVGRGKSQGYDPHAVGETILAWA